MKLAMIRKYDTVIEAVIGEDEVVDRERIGPRPAR
jgi:hypothetical protein